MATANYWKAVAVSFFFAIIFLQLYHSQSDTKMLSNYVRGSSDYYFGHIDQITSNATASITTKINHIDDARKEFTKECTLNNNKDHVNNDIWSPVMDDLAWFYPNRTEQNPRPKDAPIVGWEDQWMIDWKNQNYDANQRMGCLKGDNIETPYTSEMLCNVPAYTPARIPRRTPTKKETNDFLDNGIPQVIFLSWMTRNLGPTMFTSIMTLIHSNPDYEIVFFVDNDINHFLCDNFPIVTIDDDDDSNNRTSTTNNNNSTKNNKSNIDRESITEQYTRLRSGASRVDVWRMVMLERYGGVYLDTDMSALGPLPIRNELDSLYSGLAGYKYAPNTVGGCIEHWSFAAAPHHPLLRQTIQQIHWNIKRWKEFDVGGKYHVADDDEYSFTVSLTGPGPFQKALHDLLKKVGCKPIRMPWDHEKNWYHVLRNPQRYCREHYETDFVKVFGKNFRLSSQLNLDNSITPKMIESEQEMEIMDHTVNYDHEDAVKLFDVDKTFCAKKSFQKRNKDFERRWKKSLTHEAKYGVD